MTQPVHVAVVGAGPGGYTAAFLAADLGMTVTLIDDAPDPGGVCLYRGCMPSKALLHVAKVLSEARAADSWGVTFGEPRIDVERLRTWKEEVVGKLTGGLGQLTRQRKIEYLQGRASLVDARTVSVALADGTSQEVRFDHGILATGSRPARPAALAVEHDRILDSTGALDVRRVPSSLLVVGGGYIGLELGTVYAALGTEVTVVEMTPALLPGVDADLVRVLARRFGKVAKAVHLGTTVTQLVPDDGGVGRTPLRSEDRGRDAALRRGACCRRSGSELRYRRARQNSREGGRTRVRRGRCPAADCGALVVRDRRPLRGADARATRRFTRPGSRSKRLRERT